LEFVPLPFVPRRDAFVARLLLEVTMKILTFLGLLEYWQRSMGGLGAADRAQRWSRQSTWLSLGLAASLLGLLTPSPATAAPAADEVEAEPASIPASTTETTLDSFLELSQSSDSDPLFIESVEPSGSMESNGNPDEEDRWILRDQLGEPSSLDPDSDFTGGTSFEERQDLGRPPAWSDYDGEVEVEPITNSASTGADDIVPAIEFLQVERTPADGRTTALIQGQVVDSDGNLFSDDVLVTLTAAEGRFMGEDADEDRAGFQVTARNGEFQARLQSPLTAQWVRVRAAIDPQWDLELAREDLPQETDDLPLPNTPYKSLSSLEPVEAYTSIEFITNLRPSLVSGSLDLRFGRGNTDFFGPFEEFLDDDDDFTVDANGGLFAIGTLGEWLFTGAVNLDRGLNDDCDGTGTLFNSNSSTCDDRYPVYGDSSEIDDLTPSQDSFFARLERTSIIPGAEPDFIMWGDWQTNEFSRPSQLFSATTRTLHGAKANYTFGGLQLTAAYANDIDGFRRDTIVPNGTSGLYFLSKRLLVPGSELVFVETEEINRPGFVIERKALQRGRDYDIDYDRGSLLFRRPILATEFDPFGETLVRKVVTTYEFEDDGDADNGLIATRLQYNFSRELGQESWIGASYLNETKEAQDFSLFGLDFLIPLGSDGRLIAEYALSNNGTDFLGDVEGSAYRIEAEGKPTEWLRGRAFFRTAEEGFSNDSTFSFVPGQTRYGIQGTAQAGPSTLVRFDVEQENNFGDSIVLQPRFFDLFDPNPVIATDGRVDNSLFTLKAGVIQKLGEADLGLEYVYRDRDDDIDNTFDSSSSQIVSRLRVPLGEKFAFRAQNEVSLGDIDELYPNRTTLGVEWDTFPGVKLRLTHQFFGGGLIEDSAITSLDTIVEKALSDDTTLTSRYSVAGTQNGFFNYGSIGLNHRWNVSPGLKINLGYERIFDDLFSRTGAGRRFETAATQGQTGAILGLSEGSSYSIGADYTGSDRFKANARFEFRDTDDGDLFLATAGGVGKINNSLSILGRIESSGASNQTLIDRLGDTFDLDIGLAYRDPINDRWNGLLRLEHRVNGDITPDSIGTGAESRATLLSAEAIYAPNWRWEFYGKYAMRWTNTRINGGFSNDSRISLAQARALYRFDYRWDVASEVRWINQPTADFSEWGLAGEVGYYVNPDLRAYLGYSFGSVDDRDFGGFRSDGGIYGGVNLKVNRLFNGFGVQMPVAEPDNDSIQALGASASQEPLFERTDADPFADEAAPAESAAPEFQDALNEDNSAQEIPRALF